LNSECLAPHETSTCSGVYESPLSSLSFLAIAARSSGMPAVAVYLVNPWLSASIAASLTKRGVSKSGSPAPKLTTSTPFAASAFALAFSARVGDGLTAFSLRESCIGLARIAATAP